MNSFLAIMWRDWIYFKRRLLSITAGSLISPLLYIVTFGLGLGRFVQFEEMDYLTFLIPGIVALNTMNVSFGAVSTPLVIARLHDKTLEEYMVAPIHSAAFVAGKICAGAGRGLYSAAIIVLCSVVGGVALHITPSFILLLLLNCMLFSALGFCIAMIVASHRDMARFRSFIITPMVFVCGTFFSVNSLPGPLANVLYFLPLTPASVGLRAAAVQGEMLFVPCAIQVVYCALFSGLGLLFYRRSG